MNEERGALTDEEAQRELEKWLNHVGEAHGKVFTALRGLKSYYDLDRNQMIWILEDYIGVLKKSNKLRICDKQ